LLIACVASIRPSFRELFSSGHHSFVTADLFARTATRFNNGGIGGLNRPTEWLQPYDLDTGHVWFESVAKEIGRQLYDKEFNEFVPFDSYQTLDRIQSQVSSLASQNNFNSALSLHGSLDQGLTSLEASTTRGYHAIEIVCRTHE